mgnify:FL=1
MSWWFQNGVGQGTVPRLRRTPRERVEDVAITEASGLSLGEDGYPHPIETTSRGEVKATDRALIAVMEDILQELKEIHEAVKPPEFN